MPESAAAVIARMRARIPERLRSTLAELGVVAAVCVFLVATGSTLTASWTGAAAVLVVVAAAGLMAIDLRYAVLLFAAFLFGYEEFSLGSTEAFYSDEIRTVLGVRVFGVALMDFLTAMLLVPTLVREWRRAITDGRVRLLPMDGLLLPFVLLWVYGALVGLFHMRTPSHYTWELRDLGYMLAYYVIFSRTLDTPRDLARFLVIGAAAFLLKNGVFVSRWWGGGGLEVGTEYRRILLGSDMTLTAYFLSLTVAAQLIWRTLPRIARIGLAVLSMYLTVMLLAGLGRLTYILTAASLVMVLVLNRRRVRARSVVIALGIGALAGVVFYTTALSDENRRVIGYAVESAFSWKDAIVLYGDLSLGSRMLEALNIWEHLSRNGALLWGMGWGAPWQEYILHPFDAGSFDVVEQRTGIHNQAHIDAIQFLLKLGIAGTLLLYASFARVWRRGVALYHAQATPRRRFLVMAVLILLVVIVPNFIYFIRLHFLLGFALAAVAVLDHAQRAAEEEAPHG